MKLCCGSENQAMRQFASYRAAGNGSDRIRWMKQGAAVGAALRFLQAPSLARRQNRLNARGTNVMNEPEAGRWVQSGYAGPCIVPGHSPERRERAEA